MFCRAGLTIAGLPNSYHRIYSQGAYIVVTTPKRLSLALLVIPCLLIGTVSVTGATQPAGPVTIETVIDFSTFPFEGTFVVTEGDDILGCASGTFIDMQRGFGVVEKIFECDSANGMFIFIFTPFVRNPRWEAWAGAGAFAGIRGRGRFSIEFGQGDIAYETLTGVIHFEP
jgi:hypothetical protein